MTGKPSLRSFSHCPVCGGGRFLPHSAKSNLCLDCGFEYFLNPSAATVALILNLRGELLCTRRRLEPAKGTLDLPGGFVDMGESAEQGVAREVLEETGLRVDSVRFLFSLPNVYRYSGFDVPTLDLFFLCRVSNLSTLCAADDASECLWIPVADLRPQAFGLRSISEGVSRLQGGGWLENLSAE